MQKFSANRRMFVKNIQRPCEKSFFALSVFIVKAFCAPFCPVSASKTQWLHFPSGFDIELREFLKKSKSKLKKT